MSVGSVHASYKYRPRQGVFGADCVGASPSFSTLTAGVSSTRTNLSPFTKGYRGLAPLTMRSLLKRTRCAEFLQGRCPPSTGGTLPTLRPRLNQNKEGETGKKDMEALYSRWIYARPLTGSGTMQGDKLPAASSGRPGGA